MQFIRGQFGSVALACALALVGVSASAQQVGVYSGTTADGHSIRIDVQYDADAGQYYVDDIQANFTFNCQKTDPQEWGLEIGSYIPVANGSASFPYITTSFYLNTSMTFVGANRVGGKVQGGLPLFVNLDIPPKQAQTCRSDALRFTATYAPAATMASPAAARSDAGKVTRQVATQILR
ncbi:MAG: hypothetical protein JSR59_14060 [Proteobacteria bacterium]|nr:hypothetical protein [Pseudomonadota bacterium]